MGQITRTNFGLVKTKTLTNAQILGLPNTGGPIVIVPAIANKILVPIASVARLSWVQDYGNINAACTINIDTGGLGSGFNFAGALLESLGQVSQLLANGSNVLAWFPQVANTAPPVTAAVGGYTDGFVVNKPIMIQAANAGADFNGGDPGNVLTVTVFYCVVPAILVNVSGNGSTGNLL